MIYNLIKNGYGVEEDLNCSEKILYAANEAYNLGLSKESLKLAAGFGGGMATGDMCGAITGAIMVLGRIFVNNNAHESERIKTLTQELIERYRSKMGEVYCTPLKESYRTEQEGCKNVILAAAEILDDIIQREKSNNE